MIDIRYIRESPELVKENIKKKFQDEKLDLVDKVYEIDSVWRKKKYELDLKRGERNKVSEEVNLLFKEKKKQEAQEMIEKAKKIASEIEELEGSANEDERQIRKILLSIPNFIDESVPIGKDDSKNVELERIGEPKVFDYEVCNHVELAERAGWIDLDSARKVSGNGFYFLKGDLARLHSALINLARDHMAEKGFVYCVPPFMIRGDVVEGVMSFEERDNMMYKVDGEDLYLVGTSEHSMIGMFADNVLKKDDLPYRMTSYSPCFRKEKGAHGIEEKGLFRVHQFEKQEMIVVCEPEESKKHYEEMLQSTVEFFRKLDVPVRKLECCSGDLADLKTKSCDVEVWSPRQKKYLEMGSCSNLSDAQARRLGIKINGPEGNYFAHTLNNTVVASPRALIAILENHQEENGDVVIPEALRAYMGGQERMKAS